MVDQTEWRARQARNKAFSETELGRLYHRAISDTQGYWIIDSQEGVSDKLLRDRHDKMQQSQSALVKKLMELAGV